MVEYLQFSRQHSKRIRFTTAILPSPKKPQVVIFFNLITTRTPIAVDLSKYLYELYHFY